MLTVKIDMLDADEHVPEVQSLVSVLILCRTEDENFFIGHYHINGWFYDVNNRTDVHMYRNRKTPTPSDDLKTKPRVTHWAYVSAIKHMQPLNTTLEQLHGFISKR